jgi:hypothetical protein
MDFRGHVVANRVERLQQTTQTDHAPRARNVRDEIDAEGVSGQR